MAGTLHRENPLGERGTREERAALHNLTASSTKLWRAGTLHRENPLGERAALHNLTASITKLWMAGTLHRENPLRRESCPTQISQQAAQSCGWQER